MISGLTVYRPGAGVLQGDLERLVLMPGDILRVSVNVPYRGPVAEYTLYASIGQRGWLGFDEILLARASISCPDSPEVYTTVSGVVDIEIIGAGIAGIGGISAGSGYDLCVKIEERPEVSAEIDNIIDIAGESSSSDTTSMLGLMMPLLMMGMVIPMLGEGIES